MFSKCAMHDKKEFSFFAFMRCFECGHIFRFRSSLVRAYNEYNRRVWEGAAPQAETSDQVGYCPFCLHDFVVGR
jgi:hypothetical protein